jgi:hypothetical protein
MLIQKVRALGAEWAVRRFERYGEIVPREWPGTLGQARDLALDRAQEAPDPTEQFDVDWIAFEINRIAQETWGKLISAE